MTLLEFMGAHPFLSFGLAFLVAALLESFAPKHWRKR